MSTISENLKALRKEKGVTLKEMGESIGYSHAVIGYWENGKRDPSSDAVVKLAKYFNVSADILLGIKEW